MLHEILLSLSGQPSPLFNSRAEENAFPLVSPPEKALLASLARLSRLHAELRAHTTLTSASHPSVLCRAVSTAISSRHLGDFQRKILEVEKAILVEDSGYVGGYGIVPLSTIVGEFSPWARRLEWLWETVRLIQPIDSRNKDQFCTGVALIDYLRRESQTGYVDLKEMALHLVGIAEVAWMRQLSTWLLYGNLPILGKSDFFIQSVHASEDDELSAATQFAIHPELLPQFVTGHTASSILFIGKTLNLIRAKRSNPSVNFSASLSTSPVTLHAEHIEHLAALKSPISASQLSGAVNTIRFSLSQSTLSKLLPLPKILETLSVLHDFLLLRRGEFATALVSHADTRVHERYGKHEPFNSRNNPSGGLGGLSMKEGDAVTTLSQTLSELYSLQNEEDPADDALDLAKDLLRLSIKENANENAASVDVAGIDLGTNISSISFDNLLFPTPTSLSVQVGPPLDLFLSTSDISIYSKIHSYLLGIRRAQIHLGDLWQHTFLRKIHPSPWGPPRSSTPYGQSRLEVGRKRDNIRTRQMRPIWATSSASLFILSEIGSYFQGEVINGSWQHFQEWIGGGSPSGSRPGSAHSSKSKRSDNPLDTEGASEPGLRRPGQAIQRHDPETLTAAHRRYLFCLVESLFLTDTPFTEALRALLTSVERFIALVTRLESIQRNMDLETDEGVIDALVDYAGEEREVWQSLGAARVGVEAGIKNAVARLRDIDDSRSGEGRQMFGFVKDSRENWSFHPTNGLAADPGLCHYVPRKASGVDRLLMKLDFGNANGGIGLGVVR
ncbi:Spc98 family protein [Aspergillus ellipticus CBS 707.79]|uniref:Spindle pole body component n=1 Tax=Aspergillus ellipticus CBS 707.79 TaxID=1448320 RepID=A0A319CZ91_9EURO|nr:Spc98 family protein [Aspergillus ellipticus CBS 707.79]